MRTVPLRAAARLVNGGTPTSESEHWDGDIHWATPIDLAPVDGGTLRGTARRLTRAGLRNGSATVPAESLLLSIRAPIGYVSRTTASTAFNQGCRGLVPRAGWDCRFLQFVLTEQRANLLAAGTGSTFQELSSEALAAARVPLLGREAQRRIADFLDDQVARLDAASRLATDLASALATRESLCIDQLVWSTDVAVVPLRHLVDDIAVGIVVQPASWYSDAEGSVPAVRGTDISPGHIATQDLVRLSPAGHRAHRRSQLRRGDVLIVRSGLAGAAAEVPEELIGANCIDVVIARPGTTLNSRYLQYSINTLTARRVIQHQAVGAMQRHFGVAELKRLPLAMRDLAEQQTVVASLDALTADTSAAIETMWSIQGLLRERKQALITACVTGEFDVSSASDRAGAAALAGSGG